MSSITSQQQQRSLQRERERHQRERQVTNAAQLLSNPGQVSNSLFSEPIKKQQEDETTKRIKSTLGNFDQVQLYLINDHKPLIGISTREITRINGNKAKIEQIFSEMKHTFQPLSALEDFNSEKNNRDKNNLINNKNEKDNEDDDEDEDENDDNDNDDDDNDDGDDDNDDYDDDNEDNNNNDEVDGEENEKNINEVCENGNDKSSENNLSLSPISDEEDNCIKSENKGTNNFNDCLNKKRKSLEADEDDVREQDADDNNNNAEDENENESTSGSSKSSNSSFSASSSSSSSDDEEGEDDEDDDDDDDIDDEDEEDDDENKEGDEKTKCVNKLKKNLNDCNFKVLSSAPASRSQARSPQPEIATWNLTNFMDKKTFINSSSLSSNSVVNKDFVKLTNDDNLRDVIDRVARGELGEDRLSKNLLPNLKKKRKLSHSSQEKNFFDFRSSASSLVKDENYHDKKYDLDSKEENKLPSLCIPLSSRVKEKVIEKNSSSSSSLSSPPSNTFHHQKNQVLFNQVDSPLKSSSKIKREKSLNEIDWNNISMDFPLPSKVLVSIGLIFLKRIPRQDKKTKLSKSDNSYSLKTKVHLSDIKKSNKLEEKDLKIFNHKRKSEEEEIKQTSKTKSKSSSPHRKEIRVSNTEVVVSNDSCLNVTYTNETVKNEPVSPLRQPPLLPPPLPIRHKTPSPQPPLSAPTHSSASMRSTLNNNLPNLPSSSSLTAAAVTLAAPISVSSASSSSSTTLLPFTPPLPTSSTTNRVSSDLMCPDDYLAAAKRLKHAADRETNRTVQARKYLEAVLYFILTGNAMEQKSGNDIEKVCVMYKETLNLIRYISSKFAKSRTSHNEEIPTTDHKLTALSCRCQSLLYLKLSRLREKEIRNNFKIIQSQSIENNLPTNNSSITVSVQLYTTMHRQINLLHQLNTAHELWQQANHLIEKHPSCKAFFTAVDNECGSLNLNSSFDHLVYYVKTGLKILE